MWFSNAFLLLGGLSLRLANSAVISGCPNISVVPLEFQGEGTALEGTLNGAPVWGNFTVAANGLTHYGESFRSFGHASWPDAGMLGRMCASSSSFQSSVTPEGVYFAYVVGEQESKLASCARFFLNRTASSDVYGAYFGLEPMFDGIPPCNARKFSDVMIHIPTFRYLGGGLHTFTCALPGIIPPILQRFVNETTVLRIGSNTFDLDTAYGFSDTGFVYVRFFFVRLVWCFAHFCLLPFVFASPADVAKLVTGVLRAVGVCD
jgi:hypothetical protein